jgi:hypothetical protein
MNVATGINARSHLSLLYEFIIVNQDEECLLPLYDRDIEEVWWREDFDERLIHRTVVALCEIARCFKYPFSKAEVINYENIINIGVNQRMLQIHILLDTFTHHIYFCEMHVSDFYRFIYGMRVVLVNYKYIIYRGDFEPSNYILSNSTIFADDFDVARMFQSLNHIGLLHLIRDDVRNRYNFLKENESLRELPIELIDIITDYAKQRFLEQ